MGSNAAAVKALGITDTTTARAYLDRLLAEEGITAGWATLTPALRAAYYDGGPLALAGEAEVDIDPLVVRLALHDSATTSIGRMAARRIAVA